MSNLRPDQLSGVTGLSDNDILISEINPDSSARRVVKIKKIDLLSGLDFSNTGEFLGRNETGQFATRSEIINSDSLENNYFSFLSNVENNVGEISKNFYNTPTQDVYLSGVDVDSASNLKVYLRWDGPGNSYMGSGSIEGMPIPESQIVELGDRTRRFEGYLDNLNLTGQNFISGEANGFSSVIPLNELGAGPTPILLSIDPISSGTPKANTNLGVTHMKGGDTINIKAVFNTNDVSGIMILDSGISDGVPESNYALVDTGDSNYTATIPIEITSNRSGLRSVHIVAKNSFGTSGEVSSSSNSIDLDQVYPSVSLTNPTSYNGRSDGLRSGEFTTFSNSISNWSSGEGDTVFYSGLNTEITINQTSVFENPKTVSYQGGIFSLSQNLEVFASRLSNGSNDSQKGSVKIANGPIIEAANLDGVASSAESPNIIGLSEVKGGDVLDCYVYVEGNGVNLNQIQLSISSNGVSDGSQSSFAYYNQSQIVNDPSSPFFGKYEYKVPIKVTSLTSRDGQNNITVTAKNNFGTESDPVSSNNCTVNNSDFPIISIDSISYPFSQQAIKNSQTVIIQNSASNYDSILYSSDNDISIVGNTNQFAATISAYRVSGGYNINQDNFFITATKSSNGMVRSASETIKIANTPLSLSVLNLPTELKSSAAGKSYSFSLLSDQPFLLEPSLSTDPNQTTPSSLNQLASGVSTNSNTYNITVSDSDLKGNFSWVASGQNLAGITTSSVSVNPNYVLAGFDSREITSPPTSLGAGLSSIGTSVSNPSNVSLENVSEGGSGPNEGTIYSAQITGDGIQMTNSFDIDNKFVVTDSLGLTNSTGDFIFNLDKLNRAANTSVNNPAKFIISED